MTERQNENQVFMQWPKRILHISLWFPLVLIQEWKLEEGQLHFHLFCSIISQMVSKALLFLGGLHHVTWRSQTLDGECTTSLLLSFTHSISTPISFFGYANLFLVNYEVNLHHPVTHKYQILSSPNLIWEWILYMKELTPARCINSMQTICSGVMLSLAQKTIQLLCPEILFWSSRWFKSQHTYFTSAWILITLRPHVTEQVVYKQ
jgi:hypothetical protein